MIRIFIADDHAIVRHGLRLLLDAQSDMRVLGEAQNGRQVLLADGKQQWDILILDLSLPKVNGIEVLRRLRTEYPKLKIVVLSMYPAEQYAARLLQLGAAAYLSKDHSSDELLLALRQVACGGTYVSPSAGELRLGGEQMAGGEPHEKLSAREYQIFTLILQNHRVAEIAAELDLAISTVSNHLAHVKDKLGVRSIGEIISYGHHAGLINKL